MQNVELAIKQDNAPMQQVVEISYPKEQPEVLHFERFAHECDLEQHIGTFATVTYAKESWVRILYRACFYCRFLRPSQTHATHLSTKRIISQVLDVTSETIFENNISYSFLRDLRGMDIHKRTIPLPLYAKFPAISWMFPIFHAIPCLLMLLAAAVGFASNIGYAVVQIFTFLLQLAVISSVVVLLVYNHLTNKSRVEIARTVVFLGLQTFWCLFTFAVMIAGFAVQIIPNSARRTGDGQLYQSEFGFIFLGLNLVSLICYALSFGMYPYYAHHCKTKIECVFDTVSGPRKQELRSSIQYEEGYCRNR